MPSHAHCPSSPYPAPLRARVAEADHLARALSALCAKASQDDLAFLWLLGRADEVRTLVDEIVREWSAGSVDTAYACEAIGSYVGSIHVALHRRYGGSGASCCGPHLEPFERASTASTRSGPRSVRKQLESGIQPILASAELSALRKSAG